MLEPRKASLDIVSPLVCEADRRSRGSHSAFLATRTLTILCPSLRAAHFWYHPGAISSTLPAATADRLPTRTCHN